MNKEICKKCWNECAHEHNNKDLLWNEYDDDLWKEGRILCRNLCWIQTVGYNTSTDQIPDCCSYKLEHIVISEKPK